MAKSCELRSFRNNCTCTINNIAEARRDAFPLDGATLTGTAVLFDLEGARIRPLPPATWLEVAKRINEINFSSPHSLSPGDFRYYLPGLLLGCLCYLQDVGNPIAESTLADLMSYVDDKYWDESFIERWCQFASAQFGALEQAISHIYPVNGEYGSLGNTYVGRIYETLELIRIHIAIRESDDSRSQPSN